MLAPRWIKVFRDIWSNKTRTLLVVFSIAAGVFAIGTINTTQIILAGDLSAVYATTDPPSAILGVSPFDEDLLDAVRAMPEVKEADARRSITVRVNAGPDQWIDMNLYAVRDYDDIRVDKILPELGAWPPPEKALLVERKSLELLTAQVGESVTIEMPDGKRRELPIVGLTYHLLQPPAQFTGITSGYISLDSLEWLGLSRDFNTLNFVVAENDRDRDHIERAAEAVRRKIENSGRIVFSTFVPTPGKHPADDAIQPLLLVLSALSWMALLMSGFLVVNTINALLGQQIKQIGIMKSVGAVSRQLFVIYVVMIAFFGLLALAIGVPLGALGAYGLSNYAAGIVNFEIVSSPIQPPVLALEFIFGLLVPVAAAFVPILGGVTINVREAIYTQGSKVYGFGEHLIDDLLHRIRGLPSTLLLALRNSVRAKARLAFTLITLTLGGAAFIGVYSVRASVLNTLENAKDYRAYDLEVRLSRPYRKQAIEQIALSVPGVAKVESWGFNIARRIRADDTESGSIQVFAPPADTQLLKPTLLSGRWLLPGDANAVVVNTDLLRDEPDVKVGQAITLRINSEDKEYVVVGIARSVMAGPFAYINYPYYATYAAHDAGRASVLAIVLDDPAGQSAAAQALEAEFKNADFDVSTIRTTEQAVQSLSSQFSILLVFLFIMAALVAGVSALGLSGAMSMNVLERTREIGVMRAVGASDASVLLVFLIEGIFIGVASWASGSVFALPLSRILSDSVGYALLRAPLLYTFPPAGVALWLFGATLLAALATFMPAHRASRLSVREVLAYE
ncbi:MAG TPA: FtsX-like permease family protein [Anaerolineales bacterium]|nr:FtsX-like permease family protein [Anaerolineales bacterium]